MDKIGFELLVEQHVAYFEHTHRNGKKKNRIAIGFGTVDEAQKFLMERSVLWSRFFKDKKYPPGESYFNNFYFEKTHKGYPAVLGEVVLDGFGHGMNPEHIYSMREIEFIREDYAKAVKENPTEKKLLEEIHPKCVLVKGVSEEDLKM